MQHWEYKVISLDDGRYTDALNAYAREGWELQTVVPDVHEVSPPPEKKRSLPMPGALGLAADAASAMTRLEGGEQKTQAYGTVTTLIWVLRRPVEPES